MDKIFTNTKLIFVGLFALAVAAIWAYQVYYIAPRNRCEAAGNWWASKWRACAVPVTISNLTGRPNPTPAPGASVAGTPAPVAVPAPAAKAP